jgi:RecJ-like exonuclease
MSEKKCPDCDGLGYKMLLDLGMTAHQGCSMCKGTGELSDRVTLKLDRQELAVLLAGLRLYCLKDDDCYEKVFVAAGVSVPDSCSALHRRLAEALGLDLKDLSG